MKPHIVIYDAIFFSPHLDDAVFSQGGTIAKLTAEEKEVLVVTIFTQGESSPISGGGKNFLKKCGKTGVREMFIDRKKEDKNAGKVLGFDTLHLGYNAEIYRLRPKTLINSYFPYFRFIYPSLEKAFRGKISSADTTLQGRIKKDLKSIIKKYGKPGTKIYGPLGVGDHVDHLIVFEALNSLRIKNLFFWEDVPYSKQEKIKKRLKDLAKRKLRFSPQKVDINKHANLKKKAILQYVSQIPMLFPDGLIVKAYETYYEKINKNSLVLTNSGEEFIKPLTRLDKIEMKLLQHILFISSSLFRYLLFQIRIRLLNQGYSKDRLVDFAFKECPLIRPFQVRYEIFSLLDILDKINPRFILEIGTERGGTLFLFSQIASEDANIISVDLRGGLFGGGYPSWRIPIYKSFVKGNQGIHLIRANSHDRKTLEKTKSILNGKKLDFLFIDGDHSYEGVKQDFEMYSPLVKKNGIIAFHDIVPPLPGTGEEVSKFWAEIKPRNDCKEIVENWNQNWAGIGLIKKC